MWFFIGSLATVFFIGLSFILFIIAVQEGYLDRFETIKRLKQLTTIAIRLIENFSIATQPNKSANCAINDTKESASIHYTMYGEGKLVNIPYNRAVCCEMRQWRVYLIKNGSPIEITQQPGVPYLCTAKMLGGTEIIAKTTDSGKVRNYKNNTIPGFLGLSNQEFFYSEKTID